MIIAGLRTRLVVVLATLLLALLGVGYLFAVTTDLTLRYQAQMRFIRAPYVHSDLYGPWFGARELLAGRDPYRPEVAQRLYDQVYGEPLAAVDDDHHPRFFGFFYPPFVLVLLAPLLPLQFEVARWLAVLLLSAALATIGAMWARVVQPRASRVVAWCAAGFALLFHPSLDAIWLQQLTPFVVLALVAAYWLGTRHQFWAAGMLLAVAMAKPQIALLPTAMLLVWSVWRRERWALSLGFIVAMAALLAGSTLVLPAWPVEFAEAVRRYSGADGMAWLPATLAGGHTGTAYALVAAVCLLVCWCWWSARHHPLTSGAAIVSFAVTCAARGFILPDLHYPNNYNRTLLLIPILQVALWSAERVWATRIARRLTIMLVVAPVALIGVAWWLLMPLHQLALASVLAVAAYAAQEALPVALLPLTLLSASRFLSRPTQALPASRGSQDALLTRAPRGARAGGAASV